MLPCLLVLAPCGDAGAHGAVCGLPEPQCATHTPDWPQEFAWHAHPGGHWLELEQVLSPEQNWSSKQLQQPSVFTVQ